MGELIPFPRPEANSEPTHESKIHEKFRSNLGLNFPSNSVDFDGHDGFHAAFAADGTMQVGERGVQSFSNIFGVIELTTPTYDSTQLIDSFFEDSQPATELLETKQLYASYYIARLNLAEHKKINSPFHKAIGQLATQIYTRPVTGDQVQLDFEGVHYAEEYLIGKFAASFAVTIVAKEHKSDKLMEKIHERATKKLKQIDLSDEEREILRHFCNEPVYVTTPNGEVKPSIAVMQLLSELHPV